jgi:hypothetical protein
MLESSPVQTLLLSLGFERDRHSFAGAGLTFNYGAIIVLTTRSLVLRPYSHFVLRSICASTSNENRKNARLASKASERAFTTYLFDQLTISTC